MISKEKAIEIMKVRNSNYNFCIEYKKVFVFAVKDNTDIGGPNATMGIEKQTGKILPMPLLVINGLINDEDEIAEYNI